jgi:type IV secretion system protein TrbC
MLTYTPVPGARDEMLSPPPPCPVLKITKLQRMVFLTVNALAFVLQLIAVTIALVATAHAQTSPWETEATRLSQAFTGTIAKGFSLVAIVLGGLMLAFSEAGGKRAIGGLVFGCGLALGASNFMTWLFS